MKLQRLTASAVAFAMLAFAWWRQSAQDSEIAALRAQFASVTPPVPATVIRETRPPGQSVPHDDSRSADEVEERVAELERVASGQADIIEDLLRRLDGFEQAQRKANATGWSAIQATGAPDTMQDGDQQTAWAPAQADGGQEWLEVEYGSAVELAQVIVRETCGPGCITKITALLNGGAEIPVWQGEPPKNTSPSNTAFPAPANIVTNRVKVYLDTARVPGWNEIDAVELVGRDGSRQWGKSATASSSYGGSRRFLSNDLQFSNYIQRETIQGGASFSQDGVLLQISPTVPGKSGPSGATLGR